MTIHTLELESPLTKLVTRLVNAYNDPSSCVLWHTMGAVVTTKVTALGLSRKKEDELHRQISSEIDSFVANARNDDPSKGRQLSPVAFASEFLDILKKHGLK